MRTEDLIEQSAIEFLGWKWMTFIGMPTKSHPLYEDHHTRTIGIPVRMFFSPKMVADSEGDPAYHTSDMTEPLAYAYCSSSWYAWPGITSNNNVCADVENELRKRGLWERFQATLTSIERTASEKKRPHIISDRMILKAALQVATEAKKEEPKSC